MADRRALTTALVVAAGVIGVVVWKLCSVGLEGSEKPRVGVRPSSSPSEPSTAESVPDGHVEAVAAAEAASKQQADRLRELEQLRECLSKVDVELREFRESYARSLVGGQPARRIDRMYRISRDHLQSCDQVLQMIEGEGAIAAAEYRAMIAALLPSVLVLRDYHGESDFLEDGFARAREHHPAVVAGLARLDAASAALRRRATRVRGEIAAASPPEPRDLAVELYFALLALDDKLAAGAPQAEIAEAIAGLEAIRTEARSVVADLAGSRTADKLDDVLATVSNVMASIKSKLRQPAKDGSVTVGPNDLSRVEYDLFRYRP
jgi:hypothetical protein